MGGKSKRRPASVPVHPACQRKGCGQPGAYQVGMTFRSIYGGPLAIGKTGVRVCRQHRDEMTVEDFLTSEAVEQIQQGLASIDKAPADPASFKLTFERGN